MTALAEPIRLSIIIEWKNQDLATDDRAIGMLQQLLAQWPPIAELGSVANTAITPLCELIPVVDDEAAKAHLQTLLGTRFAKADQFFALNTVQQAGLSYYQLKHQGALAASGNVLIFLDSDVIPDQDWLFELLSGVVQVDRQFICGDTYIEPQGLMGKTFAATRFSLPNSQRCELESDVRCGANNLACSADFYRAHPFVDIPGMNRGVLPKLRRELAAQGILMHRNPKARVAHPAPNGLQHFLIRAIGRGRNLYFDQQTRSKSTRLSQRIWRLFRRAWKRIIRHRQDVGLTPAQLPLALALISANYLLVGLGTILTAIAPDAMRVRFDY